MRLLLDTHVLIWWDQGDRLSAEAIAAIRQAEQVYVSAVTGWEIAIKKSIGRLETTRLVAEAVSESGFEELPVRLAHAAQVESLPWHHRDPFDRMLVAQSRAEGLTLVTRDAALDAYDVKLLKA
ncbi:MAG: type II toxin-antitoxin system VapC family toxin [Gemmatimonadetes bacterium]|mgnify:CR=1 FL=1|nr:type II toxin-antitoxin system VapC family toxin [Gemmatimonadota bacterium]